MNINRSGKNDMKKSKIKSLFIFVWNLWFEFPEVIRFFLVGGFNTVLGFAVFSLFVFWAGEQWRQLCLVSQWVLTSFISYFLQRIFVFQTHGKVWVEYVKCCTTWIFAYVINAVTLELFFQFGMNIYLAQFIAQIVAAIVTYFAFKYWAFGKYKKS